MFSSHIVFIESDLPHSASKCASVMMCLRKCRLLGGERRSILRCESGEIVAGLIKPSKLFRLPLAQCNDLIVTIRHNTNKGNVNLLSCLYACYCLLLKTHRQVIPIMLRSRQCTSHVFQVGYIYMFFFLITCSTGIL